LGTDMVKKSHGLPIKKPAPCGAGFWSSLLLLLTAPGW
jgi:hypothetical protein